MDVYLKLILVFVLAVLVFWGMMYLAKLERKKADREFELKMKQLDAKYEKKK